MTVYQIIGQILQSKDATFFTENFESLRTERNFPERILDGIDEVVSHSELLVRVINGFP